MGMFEHKNPDYDSFREAALEKPNSEIAKKELRTIQSYKDSADINKLLKKAQRTGGLAHVQKYPEAIYGEFTGEDLQGAYGKIEKAREIFADLPSEVRNEFDNNAFAFVEFASNPENMTRLTEIIPKIAEPGTYFPNPVQRMGTGAGAATPPSAEVPAGDAPAPAEEAPPAS